MLPGTINFMSSFKNLSIMFVSDLGKARGYFTYTGFIYSLKVSPFSSPQYYGTVKPYWLEMVLSVIRQNIFHRLRIC